MDLLSRILDKAMVAAKAPMICNQGSSETHCKHHSIAKDFNQILVHEAHIPGTKEAKIPGAVFLHSHELLQSFVPVNL